MSVFLIIFVLALNAHFPLIRVIPAYDAILGCFSSLNNAKVSEVELTNFRSRSTLREGE